MRIGIALLAAAAGLALAGCGGAGSSGTTTTTAVAKPAVIEITVEGGKPVGGISRATVKKGTKVDLVVHSDVADEVHLHGYDLHTDVAAGGTAHLRFTASIPGVFEAELESRSLQILELTVQ